MSQQLAPIKFAQITSEVLEQFLASATRRIVIAKAGYSVAEVNQLVQLVQTNKISCTLYMEEGENAIRYGFGESEALPILMENLDLLNVQSVNQIRMALVIVDDMALVYAPVALAWEEAPKTLEFPNGFFGDKSIAEALFKQMGGENIVLAMEEAEEAGSGNDDSKKIIIPVPPIPNPDKPEPKR